MVHVLALYISPELAVVDEILLTHPDHLDIRVEDHLPLHDVGRVLAGVLQRDAIQRVFVLVVGVVEELKA